MWWILHNLSCDAINKCSTTLISDNFFIISFYLLIFLTSPYLWNDIFHASFSTYITLIYSQNIGLSRQEFFFLLLNTNKKEKNMCLPPQAQNILSLTLVLSYNKNNKFKNSSPLFNFFSFNMLFHCWGSCWQLWSTLSVTKNIWAKRCNFCDFFD
jgi:hypothetical protein